jgi:hypothetical protein
MEILVKPTARDVRNAKWAWYFGSIFGRLASAVLVVLVAITAVQVARGDFEVARPNFGIILFLVLLPLFIGLAGLKSPAITRFTEAPVGYAFSSDGVNVQMARASASYRWSEISRAFESKRYLVLVGSGVLQILPKRDFSSQAAGELRQVIRENLGRRARLAA